MSLGTIRLILLTVPLISPHGADQTESPSVPELAPGVRIERAPVDAAEQARRESLKRWRPIYASRVVPLREALTEVFGELEGSSLASLRENCREVRRRVDSTDRRALFPSGDVQLDRVLYGALERLRAFGTECLADRLLAAYRLLVEARAGLDWVDRRLAAALRPPVRLPGLSDRPPDEGGGPPHRTTN